MKKLLLLLAITLSTASYSQTAITDDNFQTAIDTCLLSNPEDGLCTNSEYGEMPDWDVSDVTNMEDAFNNRTIFNADISSWDTSSVTDMTRMFYFGVEFNQDIGDWEVGNVTNMSLMFYYNYKFNQDIGDWEVGNVTNMKDMFRLALIFNGDISNWNTISVNNMSYMFHNADDFNQPIGDWDVSNVTNMDGMFLNAQDFNRYLGPWCVSNFESMPSNFSEGSQLTPINTPAWGNCPTAGVDDLTQLDISIYPNPTSDMVYIDGNYTQLKVVIYNVLGKEILNKSITNSIDISHLDNGVYILQLSDGVKLSTRKIIKN